MTTPNEVIYQLPELTSARLRNSPFFNLFVRFFMTCVALCSLFAWLIKWAQEKVRIRSLLIIQGALLWEI